MTDENTTGATAPIEPASASIAPVPTTITAPDLAATISPTASPEIAPAIQTSAPVTDTTPAVNAAAPNTAESPVNIAPVADTTPVPVVADIPASTEIFAPTDSATAAHFSAMSIINGNKGLIIAAVLVIVVAIIGISAFIGYSSTEQYEGLIKRVEDQTANLKARAQ